jgi:hypothetical protein
MTPDPDRRFSEEHERDKIAVARMIAVNLFWGVLLAFVVAGLSTALA